MSKKDNKAPTEFPKKWWDIIKDVPEFKDIADASSVDDLKKIIVTCEGNISLVEKEKEEDTKLAGAKDLAKEFAAPYRDAMKMQTAKIKYAIFLLEGKGVELGDR